MLYGVQTYAFAYAEIDRHFILLSTTYDFQRVPVGSVFVDEI